jgi:predicted nucleic-acid-binding protein
MIGLDTNVLVRYLVQDDAKQAAQATQLIEHKLTPTNPGFISLIVLLELYWVLTSLYSVTTTEWLQALDDLLASQSIQMEHRDVVQATIQVCQNKKAGFVDVLISQVASSAGCTQTLTFDKAAARFAGMAMV